MVIGGFQRFSLTDFPGRIAAIVFTRCCGFRCPYCHNPELVDPARYAAPLDETKMISFLKKRQGQLQGVVITGGEPTFHEDLPEFLERIRKLGYSTKLDTNGNNPTMLERVLSSGLVDYVALDIKAPLRLYKDIAGPAADPSAIAQSVGLLLNTGIPHEMRTTLVESLLSIEDIRAIGELVRGCRLFALQRFNPARVLDHAYSIQMETTETKLREAHAALSAMGVPSVIR